MKNLIKTVALLVMITGISLTSHAQGQKGRQLGEQKQMKMERHHMIPDLTEEQQEQMKTIHLKSMKAMQPLKNSLMEKKAHLHTLSTAQKADLKAINKQIDEISSIEASMQKLRAASQQEVRSLLTEEQRIMFDSKPHGMKGNGNHRGNGPKSNMPNGGGGPQWK